MVVFGGFLDQCDTEDYKINGGGRGSAKADYIIQTSA